MRLQEQIEVIGKKLEDDFSAADNLPGVAEADSQLVLRNVRRQMILCELSEEFGVLFANCGSANTEAFEK